MTKQKEARARAALILWAHGWTYTAIGLVLQVSRQRTQQLVRMGEAIQAADTAFNIGG